MRCEKRVNETVLAFTYPVAPLGRVGSETFNHRSFAATTSIVVGEPNGVCALRWTLTFVASGAAYTSTGPRAVAANPSRPSQPRGADTLDGVDGDEVGPDEPPQAA